MRIGNAFDMAPMALEAVTRPPPSPVARSSPAPTAAPAASPSVDASPEPHRAENEPAPVVPPSSFSQRFNVFPEHELPGWATAFAFGTLKVTPQMVPSLDDQTFQDLQNHWPSSYPFVSRSGKPKPNCRIYAEYTSFTEKSLYKWSARAISFGGSRDGPTITIQPLLQGSKTTVQVIIAGRVIPGTWTDPWTFTWLNVHISSAHHAWPSGILRCSTDEYTISGHFVCDEHSVPFRAIRSRPIGSGNRLSIFSPQRMRPPIREHVKTMPFPPVNPERYWAPVSLPPDPGTGRTWPSWDTKLEDGIPIFSDFGLKTVATFWTKVHAARTACAVFASNLPLGRKSMTDAEVLSVLAKSPLPRDKVIENTEVHPTLRDVTLLEQPDGSIRAVPFRARPLLPGAVNRNAENIRKLHTGDHPWLDASLPDFLILGFPHDQHDRSFAIVLQASGQEFHRHILHWVAAYLKERKKTHLNAFTNMTRRTPPAIGGAVVVKRGMTIKADGIDWRPTVNHTAPHATEGTLPPKAARGGPSPSGDDLLKPVTQPQTVRNEKGLPRSTNDRMALTMSKYPPIQYPTPADVGLVACIYLAFGIRIILSIFDISSCFHCKAVEPCRAAESIFIEDAIHPKMEDGAGCSNCCDYGYADSADISDRCTTSLPKMLDRTLNKHITSQIDRKFTLQELEFRAARGNLFGIDSSQCFLSTSFIYVDDLGNMHPEGYCDPCATEVTRLGDEFGYKWVPEKYGAGIYTGFRFVVTSFENGRIHVKKEKIDAYAASLKTMAGRKATTDKSLESRAGELGHAAQAELAIKPLLGPFYECLHVKTGRFKNPKLRPISKQLTQNAGLILPILAADEGIPLFCDIRPPRHYHFATLTLRTDASLPSAEETSTYNGFGGWFLTQNEDAGLFEEVITIHAFYGEWTALEKVNFGSCIAAAEGATSVFGSLLAESYDLVLPHIEHFLQLTDSLSAKLKYCKMSYGNAMIECARKKWEDHSNFGHAFATLDFIPREWNVGGDLLSKGHWDTFVSVCKAAGLPAPVLIFLTPEQRDISYLWA